MAKTGPIRFKRVAAAFNEASRVIRLCDGSSSSGSEHYSPDDDDNNSSADLSDLVNSFIEREYHRNHFVVDHLSTGAAAAAAGGAVDDHDHINNNNEEKDHQLEESSDCSFSETKEMLENLLNMIVVDRDDDADLIQKIRKVTQLASDRDDHHDHRYSSQSFKRRLMSRLRDQGFDAGLCKSRWEKFGRHPAGDYEYVDVNFSGNRYIVEVLIAGEFKIARASSGYTELLKVFPQVYIGKAEEFKQIVRLMCRAMRESMKGEGMHVAPWRRNGYMQAKWFGHYKRTTNCYEEVSNTSSSSSRRRRRKGSESDHDEGINATKRAVGFDQPFPVRSLLYHCRDDFARKAGIGLGSGVVISHLTAAFRSGIGIDS